MEITELVKITESQEKELDALVQSCTSLLRFGWSDEVLNASLV
jgi:hypothetical protein